MKKKTIGIFNLQVISLFLVTLAILCNERSMSQTIPDSTVPSIPATDVSDVLRFVFKKKNDSAKISKSSGFAILPSFGYNPSFGFVIGAKVAAGIQKGNPANTDYSTIGLEALYSSKGIITAQAIHNVFTAGNKLNWQGNWQLSRFGMVDYGVGTGVGKKFNDGFVLNEFPVGTANNSFPVKYFYLRLNEKLYQKIGRNWYGGGGLSFNIYRNIKDEMQTDTFNTPHQVYSLQNGFNPQRYSANAFLIALQFNSRDHPLRSYNGAYADVSLRFNQKWLGSTKNAILFQYDFRKYLSLSSRNPAHVLAIWHWASYKLSGTIPYLDMPSTGSDIYKRSGRAYTIGRFKGPSYACVEAEYRFPILKNQLISGVCFFNLQTAADEYGKHIFGAWARGAGGGLRILLNKESRNTLCIDFSKGQYGGSGLFFGLNEVF